MRRPGYTRMLLRRVLLAFVILLLLAAIFDLRTWRLQSELFGWLGRDMHFLVATGPNPDLIFPPAAPYDLRLGYSRLPDFLEQLGEKDFAIESQAVMSETMRRFVSWGGNAPYREKFQAGLMIQDRKARQVYRVGYPDRVYESFETVPPLVAKTLLFIENRELLDPQHPGRNPAVEWDRLANAVVDRIKGFLGSGRRGSGGSTLATQIEKYRHSPKGRTSGVTDKFRQIATATARAYLDGPDTQEARRRIIVDYLNSTPLGGRSGYGEVNGLAEGLAVWYGSDFDETNRVLERNPGDAEGLAEAATVFKQILSLLLAQRRPQRYLVQDRDALLLLTDSYLRLLQQAGVIDQPFATAALSAELRFRQDLPPSSAVSFIERKAINAIRTELMALLKEGSPYYLDRLDLTAKTTLDAEAQSEVTRTLRRLNDPDEVSQLGLLGPRLLARGDPTKVIYSFTLYERGRDANYLRVQADTLDQPFDINKGAKLDLGSTAKLRTLVTYLEIVQELNSRYAKQPDYKLDAIALDADDPLTRWALSYLSNSFDRGLPLMLQAAMKRRYSASPRERFFTGGGIHTFENFNNRDDRKLVAIEEAFRNSINLPFIRLIRDIVEFYIAEGQGRGRSLLAEDDHPARRQYLARYADHDGMLYLNRFYQGYRGKSAEEALDLLLRQVRHTPRRLAATFRSLRPQASEAELKAFLEKNLTGKAPDKARVAKLYGKYAPEAMSLVDRAYFTGLHPLELWLVGYLQENPDANYADIKRASTAERQQASAWLLKTGREGAQNTRIWTVLEQEAFTRIHKDWQRLGYPFDSLVPSYATAIGSSADRPDALAELIGIILGDGKRLPNARIEGLLFAERTPYETELTYAPKRGQQVLSPAVAKVVRLALLDVVENGTARRARGAFAGDDGPGLAIGGKTGTGDNRFKTFGRGNKVVEDRVVNRTSTLVFYIGERFFGTITAYVDGEAAEDYGFTSSLPAQILKLLAPALAPLVQEEQPLTANAAALQPQR